MKRFWKEAGVAAVDGDWQVTLDGRPVRTQGDKAQAVPTRALAEALAAEWAAQGPEIDPAGFTLRHHADHAIDVAARTPAAAVAGLLPYAETDTLCYRAEPGDALAERQAEVWDPLLAVVEARYGVTFERVSGIVHRAQPPATLAALRTHLETLDPFALAALTALASLSCSMGIALLVEGRQGDPGELWAAAELEEQWQANLWGRDDEAEARRALRRAAFLDAARFLMLARA